jgi:hypothetical protein
MSGLDSPLTPEQIAKAELSATHHSYFARVLVGLDEFMNVTADGKLDETISARAQRLSDQGNEFAKLLTHGLDLLQPQHGRKAEAGQLAQAQEIEGTEKKALGID